MDPDKRQTHGRKLLQEMTPHGQIQDGSRAQASADSVLNVCVDVIRDGVSADTRPFSLLQTWQGGVTENELQNMWISSCCYLCVYIYELLVE